MFYRIAVCDDDTYFLNTLKNALLKYSKLNDLTFDIHCFSSGEELLAQYGSCHFHLLLLDMEMKQLNGIQVAQNIRKSDDTVSIIYITTYEDFALDAFRVNAESYLVKPVLWKKLCAELDRVFKRLILSTSQAELGKIYITLDTKEGIIQLSFDDIIYISKLRNYLIFHTKKKDFYIYMNLKDVLKRLDISTFVQINKGQIVNWRKVSEVNNSNIVVDGIELQISRSYVKTINNRFNKELEQLLRIRATEYLQADPDRSIN